MRKLALCILAVLLPLPLAAGAATPEFALPDDLAALMPTDVVAVVAIRSIEELSDESRRLGEQFGEDGAYYSEWIEELREELPLFDEAVDLDRPLALTFGMPPLMGGGEPPYCLIIPVKAGFEERELLTADEDFPSALFKGDYLALSTDPYYAPADALPALAKKLAPGVMTASLDFKVILGSVRPFIEMGLMSIPVADPNSPDPAPENALTPEDAASIRDLVHALMDSLDRLDLALAREGKMYNLYTGFWAIAGSPLAPSPQPDFQRALDLSRYLPENADFLQIAAYDYSKKFEMFKGLYSMSLNQQLENLPPETAERYAAWMEDYLTLAGVWTYPMASAMRIEDEAMAVLAVMECEDAKRTRDDVIAVLEGLSATGIGITLKEMAPTEAAGTEIRTWHVEYDAEQMARLHAGANHPSLTGVQRMQAEDLMGILDRIVPDLGLAVQDDYLFFLADHDQKQVERLLTNARKKNGKIPAQASAVAKKAGPECQQVIVGDMLVILQWVTSWMEDMDPEVHTVLEDNPIPFTGALTVGESRYGFDLAMELESLVNLMEAVEEFEEMHEDEAETGEVSGESVPEN